MRVQHMSHTSYSPAIVLQICPTPYFQFCSLPPMVSYHSLISGDTDPEFTRFQQIHTQYIQIYSVGIQMLISRIVLKWTIINNKRKSKDEFEPWIKLTLFIWFWNFAENPTEGQNIFCFFFSPRGILTGFTTNNNTNHWTKNAL